jgi:hypothetical protein
LTSLPDTLPESTPLDPGLPSPCPSSIFLNAHPIQDKSLACKTPFYNLTHDKHSSYTDREQAVEDIEKMKSFDANEDVLVLLAHDRTLLQGILPVFNEQPEENLRDWKEKGWREKLRWGWLNDLPRNGKSGREEMVTGVWREGREVGLEG